MVASHEHLARRARPLGPGLRRHVDPDLRVHHPWSHWSYASIGLLTSLAALVTGYLAGFLFGIPRVVSSGALRHATNEYTPSSNLAEVSDWLTKLLLGAGLVQLTRLGAPVAHLIDNIAAGLHSTAASASGAKVAAGAILFGYTITGILVGYVMTTLWYQRKITNQQTPITLT